MKHTCAIIPFRPSRRAPGIDYRCPFCGGTDGFFYIGAQAWAICEAHRVKWWIGTAIDECWLSESPRDWTTNARYLDGFQQVYGSAMLRAETGVKPVA